MANNPYRLITDNKKTTITAPGGIALGYGPGPGLRNAIFWNRIGCLFSCYRPAVAALTVFRADDPHTPLTLKTIRSRWQPNLATAAYRTKGLRLRERRTAVKSGLLCDLWLTNTGSTEQTYILCFQGQVEQWEFFDYKRGEAEPLVEVSTDPGKGAVTITQRHVHDGMRDAQSIQTVSVDQPLTSHGFAPSLAELNNLWHDHGCLESMRIRLGQVGGRFKSADGNPSVFRHRHPAYYFTVKLKLKPGQTKSLALTTLYRTDLPDGELADGLTGTQPDYWKTYLTQAVPQLRCSDKELERYWYYAWYVLRANRTAPGGHVPHPFTAPSKYMYWGTWIWDTYFHVLGEMWMTDRNTARDSIRAVLATRFPNGYLPCCSGSGMRMCFHDATDGYTCPGGGGYASYVPSRLAGYRDGHHPYEAEVEYAQEQPAQPQGEEPIPVIEREGIAIATGDIPVIEWAEIKPRDDDDPLAMIRSVLAAKPPTILLSLKGESYSDSSKLGYLVYFIKEAMKHGVKVVLSDATSGCDHILHSVGLDKYCKVFNSREQAIEYLSEQGFTLEQPVSTEDNPGFLIHNEKTQTPLITVAADEFCRLYNDVEFAREVLPALYEYEEWLWRRRVDKEGRFILWHGDESGWDDATRHYPVPAKPFDVQVHSLMHREALARLAQMCCETEIHDTVAHRAAITRKSLETYWDHNDRWYYDLGAAGDGQETTGPRRQIAASGLFAMLVEQSERTVTACKLALNHDRVFNTEYPVPTLAACDPDHQPHGWGWNGPAWLQVNYFTIVGLMNAREYGEAFRLWEKTRRLIIRDGKPYSHELYDPTTGDGLGCPDYSWQAMVNHLIVRYFAGINGDVLRPALPPGMDSLSLSNLPGAVRRVRIKRRDGSIVIRLGYSGPQLPQIDTVGLGDISTATANGLPLKLEGTILMCPADAEPQAKWEVKLTCR